MNRVEKAFSKGRAAIPFIMCGDPDLKSSEKIILTAAASGADMIVLGIPFSDPTAQSAAVTKANQRALNAGANCDKAFELIENIRKKTDIPIAIKTFANIVFSKGIENFAKTAAKLKIDALILPDVPKEESDEFAVYCEKYGVSVISTVTGASGDRIEYICAGAKGFIYCDLAEGDYGDSVKLLERVKAATNAPRVINANFSGKFVLNDVYKYAEGVLLESEISEIIEKYAQNSAPYVEDFLKQFKRSVK